jgi:predicted DNA-binding transcriptional regulator AlpA
MPDGTDFPPYLLNDKQVAQLLSFSVSWVRGQRWRRSHGEGHVFDVDSIQLGRSVRYRYEDVITWLEMRAAESSPAQCSETIPISNEPDDLANVEVDEAVAVVEPEPVDTKPQPSQETTEKPGWVREFCVGADKEIPNYRNLGSFLTSRSNAFKTCQFIADEPTATDDCKCGRPTVEALPYCEEHFALCHVVEDDK